MDSDQKLKELANLTRRKTRMVDGELRIRGKNGDISCEPEGFYLFLSMNSREGAQLVSERSHPGLPKGSRLKKYVGCTHKLMNAVERLSPPAEVTQLGEDEAVLIVREDPGTILWNEVAMPLMGIHAKRQCSKETLERLRVLRENRKEDTA